MIKVINTVCVVDNVYIFVKIKMSSDSGRIVFNCYKNISEAHYTRVVYFCLYLFRLLQENPKTIVILHKRKIIVYAQPCLFEFDSTENIPVGPLG